MDLGLNGRRALVGGGGSGIGAGIAAVARGRGRAGRADRAHRGARRRRPRGKLGGDGGRRRPLDARRTGDGRRCRRRRARRARPRARQHRRPADRHHRHPERGRLGAGDRRHAPVDPAPDPRGAAATCARARIPSILIVLSSSVREPIAGPDDLERPPPGPGRPDQVAHRRDRADPDQRPRARADRDGPDRLPRRPPSRGGRRHARGDRAADEATIPLGRYGDVGGDRAGRRVPAVARGVVRHRGRSCAVDGGMIRSLP